MCLFFSKFDARMDRALLQVLVSGTYIMSHIVNLQCTFFAAKPAAAGTGGDSPAATDTVCTLKLVLRTAHCRSFCVDRYSFCGAKDRCYFIQVSISTYSNVFQSENQTRVVGFDEA